MIMPEHSYRWAKSPSILEISCENSQNDTDKWVDVTAEISLFHFDYAFEGFKVEIPDNSQPRYLFSN